MSRILLSKLDIDVLVQLAVIGPGDVSDWEPLTDDPDRLGALLWKRNYEIAAHPEEDGPRGDYTFTPLPITVTVIEGLRQCAFYTYQTTDEEGRWKRDGVGAFLGRLNTRLIHVLPGMDEAPWGWGARALGQRADRPRPRRLSEEDEPPEDPRITAWGERWTTIGLPLTRIEPRPARHNASSDPRDLLAQGYNRPRGQAGLAPVVVTLLATVAAAETYFVDLIREHQRMRQINIHVYRWETTVAVSKFSPDYEAQFIPGVDQSMARLGDPDQHWWSLAPPLRELDAEVVASRVRLNPLTAGAHSDARAVYARTPKQLTALVAMLQDADLQKQVASVNTRKKTVLLMRGVSEIASVKSVEMEHEVIDFGRGPKLEHAMYIYTEGGSTAIGTLLVMDRLTQTPAHAVLQDLHVTREMIGDKPSPSG